jgi:hypothetical protein
MRVSIVEPSLSLPLGFKVLLALVSAGLGVVDIWPPKRELPLGVEVAFPNRGLFEDAVVKPPPEGEPVGFVASPVEEPPPNKPPDGVAELGLLPKRPPEVGAVDDDEVRGLVVVPLPAPPNRPDTGLPIRDVIGISGQGKY